MGPTCREAKVLGGFWRAGQANRVYSPWRYRPAAMLDELPRQQALGKA